MRVGRGKGNLAELSPRRFSYPRFLFLATAGVAKDQVLSEASHYPIRLAQVLREPRFNPLKKVSS